MKNIRKKYWGVDKMDIKLCVSHRIDIDSYVVSSDIITPVLCGAVYNEKPSLIVGDNTGDNISEKRSMLGEFTVEYWMWKNVKADYYGLCHYRRYFALLDKNYCRNDDSHIRGLFLDKSAVKKFDLNNDEKIREYCNQYSIIIPEPTDVTKIIKPDKSSNFKTVREMWEYGYGKDLPYDIIDTFIKSLEKQNFPLVDDLKEYLETQNHIGYNCFIVHKDVFNEMCQLIFSTISKLEVEYADIIDYNKYPRTLGYLCEIMFGIFMYDAKKNKKYKELPLVFFIETRKDVSCFVKLKMYSYEYIKKVLKKYLKGSTYGKLRVVYKKFIK